ncbi:DUF6464 family protein [Laspinema sp. D1]|uniref:DUF6464 family protein n=1 Tax=Laspinema palackyanum D2a TaxID=2953684 RepID=A0ABT2MRM8_9CYAN|nr:DUF6464 family protein [Laspinema sp. D2b]MCT7967385.1 DUF6464 family protein [Laspinema sp. D2a]
MLETLIIFLVGITPPLLSVFAMRKAEDRARIRLQAAREIPIMRIPSPPAIPADRHYVEGVGEVTGDITCLYNARSAYLRCALNPEGPCETCRQYEPRESF